MVECLYKCGSGAPSTQKYHVYPASASIIKLLLPKGVVCDNCNKYFSKLEKYFIERHPGADERLLHVKKTRKGKPPIYQSKAGLARRADKDGKHEFTFPLSTINYKKLDNGDLLFTCYYERFPFESVKISRLLVKMSIEALYSFEIDSELNPMNVRFDDFRRYARYGRGAIHYVWFAWKNVTGNQILPQVIIIKNLGEEPFAFLYRLSLPGITYLIPLPPILNPSDIKMSLKGWNVIDTNRLYENGPGKIEITLLKAQKEIIQRQIDATDAEIDRLVYELYDLTPEEIAIVEGKAKKA